jgi:hypothetical protein
MEVGSKEEYFLLSCTQSSDTRSYTILGARVYIQGSRRMKGDIPFLARIAIYGISFI